MFLCNSFHYLSREKLPDLHVHKYTFKYTNQSIEKKKSNSRYEFSPEFHPIIHLIELSSRWCPAAPASPIKRFTRSSLKMTCNLLIHWVQIWLDSASKADQSTKTWQRLWSLPAVLPAYVLAFGHILQAHKTLSSHFSQTLKNIFKTVSALRSSV